MHDQERASEEEAERRIHTKEEVERLQAAMSDALYEYATGTTNSGAAEQNQPKRTVLESANGTTTLFMPSTSSTGIGIKG